jgi:hypothetical protein
MNAREIASGLTEAQRRLLLDAFYAHRWRVPRSSPPLSRLGLLYEGSNRVTGLGLEVRAILQESGQ